MARLFPTFVTPGENFLDGRSSGGLAQFLDLGHCPKRIGAALVFLAHESRDRPAMPGDDDGLSALDLVEQFGKPGFRLQRLEFAS